MKSPKHPDRRPIRSRDHQWAQSATGLLIRIGLTANSISVLGMLAGIVAGVCFASTSLDIQGLHFWGFILGVLFTQLRLIANLLDGMVAIASRQASPVGELYNEIPDRVSDAAILIGCGYAFGGHILLGYITTILALFIAYIRAAGVVAGAPQFYIGPMAKQHRMFAITVAGLISAFLPSSLYFDLPINPAPNIVAIALGIVLVGELITVFRRLARIHASLQQNDEIPVGGHSGGDL